MSWALQAPLLSCYNFLCTPSHYENSAIKWPKWMQIKRTTYKPPDPISWPNSTSYDVIVQSSNSAWRPLDVVRYCTVCVWRIVVPSLCQFLSGGVSQLKPSLPSCSSGVHIGILQTGERCLDCTHMVFPSIVVDSIQAASAAHSILADQRRYLSVGVNR